MAESLFSRLQKLNKQVNDPPWRAARSTEYDLQSIVGSRVTVATHVLPEDAALIVECRNSLPAVLNLIEAAQRLCDDDDIRGLLDHWAFPVDEFKALAEAVAVFVSGQEEPK